jgi:hypothetical protein
MYKFLINILLFAGFLFVPYYLVHITKDLTNEELNIFLMSKYIEDDKFLISCKYNNSIEIIEIKKSEVFEKLEIKNQYKIVVGGNKKSLITYRNLIKIIE